jgi:hypothetical protein
MKNDHSINISSRSITEIYVWISHISSEVLSHLPKKSRQYKTKETKNKMNDAATPSLLHPFSSPRPCSGDHSETARVPTRPWWRVLMSGMLSGARRSVWVVGLVDRRNPCRHVRHRRGDACGCRLSFLKGVRCASSPIPSAYRGKP